MTVIACSNLKGGEGKTTLAWHLCHAAIELNLRALAVDLDPQGNLTTALRETPRIPLTAGQLFEANHSIDDAPRDGLHLLPADQALNSVAELRETRKDLVRRASAGLRKLAQSYQLVIVDTPTNAPLCYLAGLASADWAVSPVQMDAFGLAGARDMLAAVQNTKAHYNPRLRQLGFVVNRFNSRARTHHDMLATARQARLPLLDTVLGQRQAVQDSLALGHPVWHGRRADRRASAEWRAACAEILKAGGIEFSQRKLRRAVA